MPCLVHAAPRQPATPTVKGLPRLIAASCLLVTSKTVDDGACTLNIAGRGPTASATTGQTREAMNSMTDTRRPYVGRLVVGASLLTDLLTQPVWVEETASSKAGQPTSGWFGGSCSANEDEQQKSCHG
jgi:hypothetical protein